MKSASVKKRQKQQPYLLKREPKELNLLQRRHQLKDRNQFKKKLSLT